jgi:hypothetical protein
MSEAELIEAECTPPVAKPENRIIRGALNIGRYCEIVDHKGRVRRSKVYSMLNSGAIRAVKKGKEWESTPRLIDSTYDPAKFDSHE